MSPRRITIGDTPQCICPNFIKLNSVAPEKKEKWVYFKHMYFEFRFLSKVNYVNDKFIHAPTYTYNKVIRLIKLVGVVEHE